MVTGVSQELVFINDGRHRHLAVCGAALDSQHPSLTAHANTFRESNFWRQGQREIDIGAGLHRRIQIEADAACAYISCLRLALLAILSVADGHRQMQREPSRGPFVFFLLRLGHATSGKCCKHGGWEWASQRWAG